MRKLFWSIALLLLFAAIGAPLAHADTLFTYMYTDNSTTTGTAITISWTTQLIPAVTGETTLAAAALTASSANINGPCSISSVILDAGNAGVQATNCSNGQFLRVADNFTLADYSTPGTYTFSILAGRGSITDTLVVTAVQTPEPATGSLMLIGIGLVSLLLMRNSR